MVGKWLKEEALFGRSRKEGESNRWMMSPTVVVREAAPIAPHRPIRQKTRGKGFAWLMLLGNRHQGILGGVLRQEKGGCCPFGGQKTSFLVGVFFHRERGKDERFRDSGSEGR